VGGATVSILKKKKLGKKNYSHQVRITAGPARIKTTGLFCSKKIEK